ncbi:large conductance mechanosensitive channel protein MscL [Nodosilinea sp. LEGE 06152]|uniref:large conductance mechanosensitive channel protein MscL n=1 Tax=Nodosilinea sp. LEGE 06152 TaxID=2777966 RepID=UPI0018825CFB|nr:large conductance mechanosensitive channel protein MscL [Nodosilinea sp. LEGE 06152]MBE9157521.1 large conductance mechanosensitive channel protein MscL [Nodosilinea sp. LEGE 06152]
MANGVSGRRVRGRAQSFWDDFKAFALKGNVVDLAVAVIIGGAFGAIISSLVEDILMPAIINPLLSSAGTDWREAVVGPGIRLGSFLGTVIDFAIIALVLFIIIRTFERFKRKEAAAEVEPTIEEKLNDTLIRLTDYLESRPK